MSTHITMANSECYRRKLEAASRRAAAKRVAYRSQTTGWRVNAAGNAWEYQEREPMKSTSCRGTRICCISANH
jgi:hypothetical protein